MPFVKGFLRISGGGGGGGGEHPDHELPDAEGPVDPGYGIPLPPPGIWPPPVPAHPIVPAPPGTPPGVIWPPVGGGGEHPDNTLPGGPPSGNRPTHPIALPPETFWVVVWIPGYGWKYMTVDPSLKPDNTLPVPPSGNRPDNTLPVPPSGNRPDNTLPTPPPGGVVTPPIAPTPAPKT